MNDRGTYGRAIVGANGTPRGPSLVGVVLVIGGVLWARHQARQIDKLSAAAGIPQESFAADLRERAKQLSSGLTRRLSPRKDT